MLKEHKYNAVVLDTLTQVINDTYTEHLKTQGKLGHDEWRDFGVEILNLYMFIRSLSGAVIVQVLGSEGTGKTVGARTLNPETTMYLNQDKKPLTFLNAEEMYPNDKPQGDSNSLANYKEALAALHPTTKKLDIWHVIHKAIQYAYDNRVEGEKFVVFVLAHTEVYKGANGIERERLRVIGRQATRLNIEGSLSYTFYSKIDPTGLTRADKHKLAMHNSGFNTARVPMGLWDDVEEIPNDFQAIMDKINHKV